MPMQSTQTLAPAAEIVRKISGTLNRLTGYEDIDALKGAVASADEALASMKRQVNAAKADYDQELGEQGQLHRQAWNSILLGGHMGRMLCAGASWGRGGCRCVPEGCCVLFPFVASDVL